MIALEKTAEHTHHYLFEPNSFVPLAQIVSANDSEQEHTAYYHVDHLGTPQTLSDENGEIAWSAEYKAWGEAKTIISEAAKTAGINNQLRFQGQYTDEESGLHYNRYRYYDPEIGRFISSNPIKLAGGSNLHQFAPNPISWLDPLWLARIKNAVEGDRRHQEFNEIIKAENTHAKIQSECYLRDKNGKSVKDPITGERRRVDTAVIENGKAKTYEVTSTSADKQEQLAKEGRIMGNGGNYIRDRSTGELIPTSGLSEIVRLP
ncbi:RHS repeat domain-containing protein [Iodobacter violaceini]|uniref:RHS repeat domain-containing protein n=1 Tax=Iodobacter violaceini TaxID=3044271 RepID=UPI00197B75EE|nr:RHS repeat-associated core domain-containing protein [Iodobacter violacea]